jgi:hypothetical protein
MPRVLITAPTLARRDAIAAVVQNLPPPAAELFRITTLKTAPDLLIAELTDERTPS